jgi:RNA polymerase sigma-70 factor (ECF subfamily)
MIDDGGEAIDALPAPVPVAAGEMVDLERAVAALPPGARKVFVMHDIHGFTHEEVANALGVTTGATKAQLHRARMLLREALNR